ncbi:hypothetical protein PDIG_72770 [Penicillium digitatum PHI26]|uniref:Uncharacterized protein n=2 Tax=Penicillium digitatum TaxID=36651 RepID=K9G2G7_PEND2|nr:hypothetical protein PDIP_43240 [Penicillium digitatum Pd1]EKV07416.1 hypothetical protein PDIG_72770 [Penicillium digitatum PHI26]EKV14565.1 hypothetical protein PDIP_43240 [Penicillium digitatum Pd1]
MTTPNPTPLIYPPLPLTQPQLTAAFHTVLDQIQAYGQHKKRPFAAILQAPDHKFSFLSLNSLLHVRHAERELAHNAADSHDWAYLARCTPVSTREPCARHAWAPYLLGN